MAHTLELGMYVRFKSNKEMQDFLTSINNLDVDIDDDINSELANNYPNLCFAWHSISQLWDGSPHLLTELTPEQFKNKCLGL